MGPTVGPNGGLTMPWLDQGRLTLEQVDHGQRGSAPVDLWRGRATCHASCEDLKGATVLHVWFAM